MKDSRLVVRMEEEELAGWRSKAEASGMEISEYVRSLGSSVESQAARIVSLEADVAAGRLAMEHNLSLVSERDRLRGEVDALRFAMTARQVPHESHTPAIQGVQVGANGVSSEFWAKWSRESKRYEGEDRDQFFKDAVNDRVAAGLTLPSDWHKRQFPAKIAWLRAYDRDEAI